VRVTYFEAHHFDTDIQTDQSLQNKDASCRNHHRSVNKERCQCTTMRHLCFYRKQTKYRLTSSRCDVSKDEHSEIFEARLTS